MADGKPTIVVAEDLVAAYDHFNERLFNGELEPCLITLQRRSKTFGYYAPGRFLSVGGEQVCEIAMNPSYFASRPLASTLSTLAHEMVHLKVDRVLKAESRMGYHCAVWASEMDRVGLVPTSSGQPGGARTGYSVTHYISADGAFAKACDELIASGWTLKYVDRDAIAVDVPASPASLPPAAPLGRPGDVFEPGLEEPPAGPPTEPKKPRRKPAPPPAAQLGAPVGISMGISPSRKGPAAAKRDKYKCASCTNAVWGKPGLKIRCEPCDAPFVVVGGRSAEQAPSGTDD
jgi:predicted SprT family Zn-dependent metalloprotease